MTRESKATPSWATKLGLRRREVNRSWGGTKDERKQATRQERRASKRALSGDHQ